LNILKDEEVEDTKMEMRKVLVCLLVLGLTSVAGAATAGFVLDGGGYSVQENSTATINVVSDLDVANLGIGAIAVTGGSVSAVGAVDGKLGYHLLGTLDGTLRDGSFNNIVISVIRGSVGLNPGQDVPVSAGNPVYSFSVQTGAAGTSIYIDDWSGSGHPFGGAPTLKTLISDAANTQISDIAGLQLSVVPEPMTVVLLGLGGLFLRRRK
jgi:hypothetical protein